MEKLISVIIPVYNGAKYIENAVESVLKQPCADVIEIIIIDDGSTDNSGEVCDSLASHYENIRVIHKQNEGVSVARNIGIEEASGVFIAFLDCDDWWEPNFFDEQIKNEFEANKNCDIFQFSYNQVDFTKRYVKNFAIEPSRSVGTVNNSVECDWAPHWTYMYRRVFLVENKLAYPTGIKIAEDLVFIEKSHFLARSKNKINKTCYNYLLNATSVIHTANPIKCMVEYIKCANHLSCFYSQYSMEYRVNHLNNISKMLPELCAQKSYSDCKEFFVQNNLQDEFLKDTNSLSKKSKKRVVAWMKHPRLFWIKSKLLTKPFLKIKRALFKNGLFLRFMSFLKYKLGSGWKKVERKSI